MLKELSWYIETNRFTNIVEEIEEKAEAYREAIITDAGNKDELRDDLRALCQWHMEKSGYKAERVPYINVDLEFFIGHEINRAALDTFEKEIVKAHMYQKHLWEFMGTTGSMTVISRTAMRQDGFAYESYLPLEYRKTHRAKSPVSNILKENPSAVPFYIYPDGTVSSEYNPEKSKCRLDALRDKSGFDWTRKGWDPNYEVRKDGWHGEYDGTGTWAMVREEMKEHEKTGYAGARPGKLQEIEILKDGDSAILYDPNYSLISTSSRIFLLADGNIYGAEQENAEKTVFLIKEAMGEMGIKSIKAICGGKDRIDAKRLNARVFMEESSAEDATNATAGPMRQGRRRRITNGRILSFYKKLLGETLQDNARVAGCKEYRKTRKELAKKAESKRIEESGRVLLEKISAANLSGAEGEELIRAIQTGKTNAPLSVFNSADKKETGLTDEEFNQLQSYAVPENKRGMFSRAILNLLLERETIKTSGKKFSELFDTVYADVVQGKKSGEAISVETTFSKLCSIPNKSLGCESVEASTIEKLREAKKSLPAQRTPELQKKVDAAVGNIIRNFSAVRMSTGMTPEEAVKLAARAAGGKDSVVFVPPASGIVYQTPVLARSQEGSGIRIFSDIKVADLIETSKNLPPPTKEIEIERLIAESRGVRPKEAATPFSNLFDKAEREEWYKTESFRKTGLSVSDVENLVQSEEEKMREEISSSDENIIKFSRMTELDRKMGYTGGSVGRSKNALIARIEPATHSLSAEDAARRLNWKSNASDIPAGCIVAQINADGRLTREQADAINAADFPWERNRIIGAHNSPSAKAQARSQALADIHYEGADSETSRNTENGSDAENIGKGFYPSVPARDMNLLLGAGSHAEIVHYPMGYIGDRNTLSENKSAHSLMPDNKNNSAYSSSSGRDSSENHESTVAQSNPMPALEQEKTARLERMSANYGHDRAVLAKTDPLFARSEFRDAGHAEGSSEMTERDLNELARIRIAEKKNILLDEGALNEY